MHVICISLFLSICAHEKKVCQSGRLLRSNKPLGVYKMDVGTVYATQGLPSVVLCAVM